MRDWRKKSKVLAGWERDEKKCQDFFRKEYGLDFPSADFYFTGDDLEFTEKLVSENNEKHQGFAKLVRKGKFYDYYENDAQTWILKFKRVSADRALRFLAPLVDQKILERHSFVYPKKDSILFSSEVPFFKRKENFFDQENEYRYTYISYRYKYH